MQPVSFTLPLNMQVPTKLWNHTASSCNLKCWIQLQHYRHCFWSLPIHLVVQPENYLFLLRTVLLFG